MQVIDYNVITLRGKRYIEFPFMEKFGIKLMLSSSDAYRSFDAPEEKILDLSAAYGYFGTNKDWVFSGYQRHGTNIEIIKSLEDYIKLKYVFNWLMGVNWIKKGNNWRTQKKILRKFKI